MSSSFGSALKITIFGQSHAPAVGIVIEGLPAGEKINMEELQHFLDRRAPGRSALSTSRREEDVPEILSGLADGVTCGAPLTAILRNKDTRSSDYDELRRVPRPGHADYPASVKYHGFNDIRGGGQFSARLTAPMCVAGGILLQIFARRGIRIGAHISEIAGIRDDPFDEACAPDFLSGSGGLSADDSAHRTVSDLFDQIDAKPFPVLCREAGEAMQKAILEAKQAGDSVGGIVECMITGLPAGLCDPIFGSFEGLLSQAVFGIPAVKGIEFGSGFEAARLRGSENNDPYRIIPGKTPGSAPEVRTLTNNHGGILGGLTTGMPVIFRAAFKPTPSIALPQKSVDLISLKNTELIVKGRHDPCVVPRAVPCVMAAAAIATAQILPDLNA